MRPWGPRTHVYEIVSMIRYRSPGAQSKQAGRQGAKRDARIQGGVMLTGGAGQQASKQASMDPPKGGNVRKKSARPKASEP